MDVYGREGYIDSNYNTQRAEEASYFSPIKTASIIKLKQSKRDKSLVDLEREPQVKSPDQIPKSAILETSPLSNALINSNIINSRKFKEAEPSPRNPLNSTIGFGHPIKKNDLLSNEVSFTGKLTNQCSNYVPSPRNRSFIEQLEGDGNVVVFDKKQMKQFLLGVWDQMSTHLGTINSLQQKLGQSADFLDGFEKKGKRKKSYKKTNEYGVPIYEKSSKKVIFGFFNRKKSVTKNRPVQRRLFQKKHQAHGLNNSYGNMTCNEIIFSILRFPRGSTISSIPTNAKKKNASKYITKAENIEKSIKY